MCLRVVSGSAGVRTPANGKPISETEGAGVGTTTESAASDGRRRVLQLEYDVKEDHRQVRLFLDGGEFRTDPAPPPAPAFPARFLSARWRPSFKEDAEFFGELAVQNKEEELIRSLQLLEPRLKRLSTIVLAGQPMLHADVGLSRLVPLAFLGDGLLRVARLILAILHTKDGVVLVDEIENGLHHSVMKQVWGSLARAAEDAGVQIFATTHSRECVGAAHRAFAEMFEYDFSLQRLEWNRSGDIRAVAYDREALEGAIQAGFEVR